MTLLNGKSAVSFDVCGLDDPKINIGQYATKDAINLKHRKHDFSDSGLKISYRRLGNRIGSLNICTRDTPYACVIRLLQVIFVLLRFITEKYTSVN